MEDSKRLGEQLNLHFNILRDITNDNIIFEQGEIKDITSLEIVKKNNKIIFNFVCRTNSKSDRASPTSNKGFSPHIKKYLKTFSENYVILN